MWRHCPRGVKEIAGEANHEDQIVAHSRTQSIDVSSRFRAKANTGANMLGGREKRQA